MRSTSATSRDRGLLSVSRVSINRRDASGAIRQVEAGCCAHVTTTIAYCLTIQPSVVLSANLVEREKQGAVGHAVSFRVRFEPELGSLSFVEPQVME